MQGPHLASGPLRVLARLAVLMGVLGVLGVWGSVRAMDLASDDRTCGVAAADDGWRCSSGECIPSEWLCDGEAQCPYPDRSDEEAGCQVHAQSTPCKSWNGRLYVPCPDQPGRCVEDVQDCQNPESSCPHDNEGLLWRCMDGRCIKRKHLCDGLAQCEDNTDESLGCKLFNNDTECPSWSGQLHVPCQTSNESSALLCTLPEFADNNCRQCERANLWRCNNGLCIENVLVQDGYVHCMDGSDENLGPLKWWIFLVITLVFGLSGMVLSFLYRILKDKKHIFDCGFCRSSRSGQSQNEFEMMVDSAFTEPPDEGILPFDLIQILDNPNQWSDDHTVLPREKEAIRIYARVHQNPKLYKNLYRFLVYRIASPQRLGQVMELLLKWERDFHDGSSHGAAACWRLHLGACEILSEVLAATKPRGVCSTYFDWYLPVKNKLRKWRLGLSDGPRNVVEKIYQLFNTIYYMIKPFLGATFFYFDMMKDIAITWMLMKTLVNLSSDTPIRSFPFETFVVGVMGCAIFGSFLMGVYISFSYSDHIFELCDHKHTAPRTLSFRTISMMASIFMPAFILANHVFYLQQEYKLQRELQDPELSFDFQPYKSASTSNLKKSGKTPHPHLGPSSIPKADFSQTLRMTTLFQQIERSRYKCHLHRRIYSCYRIAYASIQTFSVMMGMIVIIFVDAKPSRRHNNVLGAFSQRLRDFFQVAQTENSLLVDLDIVRNVVLGGSIGYSFVIIISALLRYVNQCKGTYLSRTGKVFLLLYFGCHLTARVALFLGMTITAQNTGTLFPVTLIATCLFIFHAIIIYYFKWRFVKCFKESRFVERIVHVLANTIVAIPFMKWNVDVVNAKTPSTFNLHHRSLSFPLTVKRRPVSEPSRPDAFNQFSISNFCQIITAPLVKEVGNVRQTLIDLWWNNPQRDLHVKNLRQELPQTLSSLTDEDLNEDLTFLSENGYVNFPLYHPHRTKFEYFYLVLIHFVVNCISFGLEVFNGGTPTQSGPYYSWDVRLATFFLGVVFLCLYYRHYHILHDFNVGGCCDWENYWSVIFCVSSGEPLKAILREEKMRYYLHPEELSSPSSHESDIQDCTCPIPSHNVNRMGPSAATVTTQTSVIEEQPKLQTNQQYPEQPTAPPTPCCEETSQSAAKKFNGPSSV
ncbi:uncharacterized protein LOC131881331 [Tigriopus californicus]|uniref:uncharacterized protein LOC131881331 n=1 Tax=Tigriopus californicus TaxID=6832 RepID=UPI0027DA2D35|nr:uncharacterized protein LOC131881331 [Tigriopus californicus]